MYMKPMQLVKNSLMNSNYYTTYGAYGISGFIMAIYFCEWKQVGQYIPLWNKRYSTE
ncbi:hypothetical protein V3C99_005439 [Haemonchus contortus]